MEVVAPPMMMRVMRKVYLRPIRSPMRPKTIAPKGRTANPPQNVSRPTSSERIGSPAALGKKKGEMIGVRVPKMKKSYQSITVPADAAVMISGSLNAGFVGSPYEPAVDSALMDHSFVMDLCRFVVGRAPVCW